MFHQSLSISTCSCANGKTDCFSVPFQYLHWLAAVSIIKLTAFQESSLRKNFISDTCFSTAIQICIAFVNFLWFYGKTSSQKNIRTFEVYFQARNNIRRCSNVVFGVFSICSDNNEQKVNDMIQINLHNIQTKVWVV